jgi:hypothetical protein
VHSCAGKYRPPIAPLDAPPRRVAHRLLNAPTDHCKQRRLAHDTRRRKSTTSAAIAKKATAAPGPSEDRFGQVCELLEQEPSNARHREPRRATTSNSRRETTTTASCSRRIGARQRPPRAPEGTHSSHPTHPRRDVRQEELSIPKNGQLDAPRVIQPANRGSSTTGSYSPRESVPPRGRLGRMEADALLGFRLSREFSLEVMIPPSRGRPSRTWPAPWSEDHVARCPSGVINLEIGWSLSRLPPLVRFPTLSPEPEFPSEDVPS